MKGLLSHYVVYKQPWMALARFLFEVVKHHRGNESFAYRDTFHQVWKCQSGQLLRFAFRIRTDPVCQEILQSQSSWTKAQLRASARQHETAHLAAAWDNFLREDSRNRISFNECVSRNLEFYSCVATLQMH
jgi:hypothetical protein